MKKSLLIFTMTLLGLLQVEAQIAKTQVLMINATADASGITLNWPAMPGAFTGQIFIYKRDSLRKYDWGNPIATLTSTATSYKDINAKKGQSCEYRIVTATGNNAESFGYLYAGNELKETPYKGGIVLLIDSNYLVPLAFEINRISNDLEAEGWQVSKLYVKRTSTAIQVKNKLKSHINARKNKPVTTLFILGHVPVPYSGGYTGDGSNFPPPDGHVEGQGYHTGAWPADGYYGDIDRDWTDNSVVMTTGTQTRHHNLRGDGKFDHVKFPSKVELEVGRVDLFGMTAFGKSDTVLTRNYLNRNHLWRTGQSKTTERALIDNNFTSFNLASTGYHNFSGFFHKDSIFDNRDYITTLKSNSYLWSYGCGAGSYTSCSGIGNTNSFVNDSIKTIFTILAGSYFGDWDIANNFLKAPLAKGSLASFWGGIPKWYIHTMGLGKNIGFGTVESFNNTTFYFNGGFNYSDNSVHMALMGDPSLCNRHLPAVKGLTATSVNKRVSLKWNKTKGDFDGYAVYRVDTTKNIYIKATPYIIKDTVYTDSSNYVGGDYTYFVYTIKKETTASGSYYNLGAASKAFVKHSNRIQSNTKNNVQFYPNPSTGIVRFNQESLHSFMIFDRSGKSFSVNKTDDMSINIEHLPEGIYILRCLDENDLEISVPIIKLAN